MPDTRPQIGFRDPEFFPYLKLLMREFKLRQIGARYGIESITGGGMWKNNPRDYGIARNSGPGLRDRRTVFGTLLRSTTENDVPCANHHK